MTSVHDHFHAGRLADAIGAQAERVRSAPMDAAQRLALCGLLCVDGQFERADVQLGMAADLGPDGRQGAAVLRSLLQAEEERRRVFAGAAPPNLAPGAPQDVAAGVDLPAAIAGGNGALVSRCLAARAAVSEITGAINGDRITSVRDADELLGPVLEAFAGGRYLWMPFALVRSLRIAPPRTVIDLVWSRAELTLHGGEPRTLHVPVLYPGSAAETDVRLKLGRITCWVESFGLMRGTGQRLLRVADGDDVRECPILQVRELSLDAPAANGTRAVG